MIDEIRKEGGIDCDLKIINIVKSVVFIGQLRISTNFCYQFCPQVRLGWKAGEFLVPIEVPVKAGTQTDGFIEEKEDMAFKRVLSILALQIVIYYIMSWFKFYIFKAKKLKCRAIEKNNKLFDNC